MTSKPLFLSLLVLLIFSSTYAQTSAETSGIAIQGIARDNNNTARVNATLNLEFLIYHGTQVEIWRGTNTVTTDAFGVFSLVIDPGADKNVLIANNQASLMISEGGDVISDEKLKHVPYAIAANNGVPTGSIMPYLGTAAPKGWVLCNGAALPTDGSAANLITLIGANAPDLGGMFLRGAGTNSNTSVTTTLNQVQDDTFEGHGHGAGNLKTSINGDHNHHNGDYKRLLMQDGLGTKTEHDNSTDEPNIDSSKVMPNNGDHSHTVNGSTANTGADETRPVNYGVNYIIKL